MVAVARAKHPGIRTTEGDAEALPYPDGRFDSVVSSFGLHHVPRPKVALVQAYRVLVAGGRVAFTVWAAPAENIAWRLVFDAVARCGDRAAAKAPPPGGSFNLPDDCLRALAAAGLVDRSADILRAEWLLPNARTLIDALSAGTVRMAALIAAQEPSALPAIIADIDRAAERYRRGDHLAIPIAGILARGQKA
jgi:SAM-dependent methyltransferase